MLPLYLKKKKIVTGPLKRNTSHSRLDVLRRNLLGLPLFQGGERFLLFGAALHEVFLENKFDSYNKLSSREQLKINKMVAKLKRHPIVQALNKGSVNEDKKYGFINGVQLAYILDNKQEKLKRGADLKTTVCKTQQDFEQKAVEYRYIDQGHLYKKMEGLKEFYFYAICKEPPYNIFILDLKKFKTQELYASKELEWLLYMYENYGNFVE